MSKSEKVLMSTLAVALIVAVLILAFYKKPIQKTETISQTIATQLKIEREHSEDLKRQVEQQTQLVASLQSEMRSVTSAVLNSNRARDEVTIHTVADPVTGKILERFETYITEREETKKDETTDTYTKATSTTEINTAATTTETLKATDTVKIVETSTSTLSIVRTETPLDAKKKSDGRFRISSVISDTKVKPVIGFDIKTYKFYSIVKVVPGAFAGINYIGLGTTIGILNLPRVGGGYGCSWKLKDCKPMFILTTKFSK